MSMVKITLVKSLGGRYSKHIQTANSLGLYKIGDSTVQQDNEAVMGKCSKICYLVNVEKLEDNK